MVKRKVRRFRIPFKSIERRKIYYYQLPHFGQEILLINTTGFASKLSVREVEREKTRILH